MIRQPVLLFNDLKSSLIGIPSLDSQCFETDSVSVEDTKTCMSHGYIHFDFALLKIYVYQTLAKIKYDHYNTLGLCFKSFEWKLNLIHPTFSIKMKSSPPQDDTNQRSQNNNNTYPNANQLFSKQPLTSPKGDSIVRVSKVLVIYNLYCHAIDIKERSLKDPRVKIIREKKARE